MDLGRARVCIEGVWFELNEFNDQTEFDREFYGRVDLYISDYENIHECFVDFDTINDNFFVLRDIMDTMDNDEMFNKFLLYCSGRDIQLEDTIDLLRIQKEFIEGILIA